MSNQPQILRAPDDLPPIPGGNVMNLIRANPRRIPGDTVVYTSVDRRTSVRYGEVITWADQLAYGLRYKLHLAPGDRVALVAPNSTFYPVVVHACLVAGVVPVPLGPTSTAQELAHPLTDAQIKYVFAWAHGPSLQVIRDALRQAEHPHATQSETIWLISDANGLVTGPTGGGEKDLRTCIGKELLPVQPIAHADTTVATIIYSSGTTGRMKGTLLSHRNLSAAIMMNDAGASLQDMEPERGLCFLPMYHGFALVQFVLRAFQGGMNTVVTSRFDLEEVCKAVQDHKITYLVVVPPIMVLLVKAPVVSQYDLSSLKFIASGAAPLSDQLANEVRNRLNVLVAQGYAMSETSVALSKSAIEHGVEAPTASSGSLLPGIEARLVELDTGKEVGLTQGQGLNGATLEGEIWVRGPNVFLGYLNNEQATGEAFQDGWFRTGDLAYFKDGLIYLTGRSKDLIKVGGRQVAPAELEAVLHSFDKVQDCAVVPYEIPEKATEYPLAFVVPKPEYKNAVGFAREVQMHVDDRVAYYKRLRGGIRLVDTIPKIPSGKILHRVLRDLLKNEAKAKL